MFPDQFKGCSRERVSGSVSPLRKTYLTQIPSESFWAQPLIWNQWALLPSMSGNLIATKLPDNSTQALVAIVALKMKGPLYSSPLYVSEDKFLMGSDGGDLMLCQIEEFSGTLRIRTIEEFQLKESVHGNILHNPSENLFLVPCYDGSIHFFEIGKTISHQGKLQISAGVEEDIYSSPVQIGMDRYIVGSGKDIVFFSSKEILKQVSTGGDVDSSPAVSRENKTVGIGSDDGIFRIFDTETLEIVFSFNSGSPIRTSPAVDQGTFIFGNAKGNVFKISSKYEVQEVNLDNSILGAPYTKNRCNSFYYQSFSSHDGNFYFLDGLARLHILECSSNSTQALLLGEGLHATPLVTEKSIVTAGHFGDFAVIPRRFT